MKRHRAVHVEGAQEGSLHSLDLTRCYVDNTAISFIRHSTRLHTLDLTGTLYEEELSVTQHHNIPFIHPLYTFVAAYAPTCTRYTCINTIYTPLNTSKHPLYTLYTP